MPAQALQLALRVVAFCAACALWGCQGPVERVFTYSSDGPSRTGLFATPEGAVLGNEGGVLVLLGYDGKPKWRVLLGREVAARPVATEDTVVAATLGGEWVGLSLADGQEKWRQPHPPPLTPLSTDGQRLFSVGQDGAVESLDAASATVHWSRPGPPGLGESHKAFPAPRLVGDTLYVGLGEAGLFALRASDGEARWRASKLNVQALWTEGLQLFVATKAGDVLSLDAGTGAVRWSHTVGRPITSGLALVGGRLWLGTNDQRLLALDPDTGQETWRTQLPGPLLSRPVPYRELLMVPTAGNEGLLLGLRPPEVRPIFQVRTDSPLKAEPLVQKDVLLVPASDGRVLGIRLRATPR